MIIEERTNAFHSAAIRMVLELYGRTSALNRTGHLRAFASLDDRTGKPAAVLAEETLHGFLSQLLALFKAQESRFPLPAVFSPKPIVEPAG